MPNPAVNGLARAMPVPATIVNGVIAIESGEATGNSAGQVLKGRLAA